MVLEAVVTYFPLNFVTMLGTPSNFILPPSNGFVILSSQWARHLEARNPGVFHIL